MGRTVEVDDWNFSMTGIWYQSHINHQFLVEWYSTWYWTIQFTEVGTSFVTVPASRSMLHLAWLAEACLLPLLPFDVVCVRLFSAQPLPAAHGGALQQTNWRLPSYLTLNDYHVSTNSNLGGLAGASFLVRCNWGFRRLIIIKPPCHSKFFKAKETTNLSF